MNQAIGRRELLRCGLALTGLGALAGCGVLAPQAQHREKVPRLGFLSLNSMSPTNTGPLAFGRELHRLGYVEGESVAIDWRWAEGRPERLPDLADELVRLGPDVLFAAGGLEAIRAAQRATETIPIVFITSDDPMAAGLVTGLAQPRGNITGLSSLNIELDAKRVQLLTEALPGASRVAALAYPADPATAAMVRAADLAARSAGVELRVVEVPDPEDALEAAFRATRADGVGAGGVVVLGAPRFVPYQGRMGELASAQRLPAISAWRQLPEAGGLMSYGTNVDDLFRRAAQYVDKILRGAKPADLPVERPTTFEFVLNLKAARALGLTIPPSVLQQATEIIQ